MGRWQGTTTQRGYGRAHQLERERRLTRWHPGDPCARCGQPMWGPADRIHLGHTEDRTGYTGLEHSDCNTREGARRGNQNRGFKPAAAGSNVRCKTCGQPYSRAARACEMCGTHYHPSYGEQRTCGRKCGSELQRRNKAAPGWEPWAPPAWSNPQPAPRWVTSREWLTPVFRTCGHCGEWFIARAVDQRACSTDCGRRLNWAKSNAARRITERTCPCGATIQPHRHKCDDCISLQVRTHKAECRHEGCSQGANRTGRLCSRHYLDALPPGRG